MKFTIRKWCRFDPQKRVKMRHRIICDDAVAALKTLRAGTVHCCVTSPPYFGLRDYGVSGQIGNEDMPHEYIRRLVDVFSEVGRVLRDDGTLWLNIGDTYTGAWRGWDHDPLRNRSPQLRPKTNSPNADHILECADILIRFMEWRECHSELCKNAD